MLTYVILLYKHTQPPIHYTHACMHTHTLQEFHKNIPSCNYSSNKNYSQVQSVHCVMNQ